MTIPGQLTTDHQEQHMETVYTNRRRGEERIHVELTAEEVAALAQRDPDRITDFINLMIAADRRFHPVASS